MKTARSVRQWEELSVNTSAGSAGRSPERLPTRYSNGDTWDRMLQQGIQLLDRLWD
jgi:hypothetical protein